MTKTVWHPADIIAAPSKRGTSLAAVSRRAGLALAGKRAVALVADVTRLFPDNLIMSAATRRLFQSLATGLSYLATACGAASGPPSMRHSPCITRCPVSLWLPPDKRHVHAFWRVTPPQRQFFVFPLCMIHINAP